MIKLKSNNIILENGLFDGYIYIEKDKIVNVSSNNLDADIVYDFTDKYISPGFIDMHTHGGGGYAFMGGSADEIVKSCNFHLSHGTTSILPTVSSAPMKNISNAVKNISIAMGSSSLKSNIIGTHIEGPYFSSKQCGAQHPDYITDPIKEDYVKIVKKYGKFIRRWSYAPERDTNGEFCKFLTDNNIIASAGHTDAKYYDMKVAMKNGCNLITHLYSCTSTVTRDHGFRSLGVIESAFLEDELFVEIIADGRHMPPELIKMIIKIKGQDNVALITDSMNITGTDIKEQDLGGVSFIVEDGVCKLKDRSAFCGSIATSDRLIRVLVNDCGYSVDFAVQMLTKTPAKILGLNKGIIKKNFDADIVVFDKNINVSNVFVLGNKVI